MPDCVEACYGGPEVEIRNAQAWTLFFSTSLYGIGLLLLVGPAVPRNCTIVLIHLTRNQMLPLTLQVEVNSISL
jgi:hypothetical protein